VSGVRVYLTVPGLPSCRFSKKTIHLVTIAFTMSSSVSHCLFAGLVILLSLPSGVLTQGGATTPTPIAASTSATLTPITTGTVIRPSNGETITIHETAQIYSVVWSPPPLSGPIGIEVWSYDQDMSAGSVFGSTTNSTSCDGWLVNGYCANVASHLLSGSTSFRKFPVHPSYLFPDEQCTSSH
jgi:hypothetical protein